ncbi:aspartate racemase [Desulfomarina profundi]|uniref:Aspartate racemase n=1 Tax=Desulfomarina profundi TaxID=2772557 RepID=A0A8D5JEV5_9BACT|nr:aspartate/glutamate racemase family protein [Desulfomarina profundi]BCL63003.1 aspartate racemase [Desulfomarina profundi]
MKTIGLLGGMSWESTTHYYALLNEGINQRLGGLHSAEIVMESVNFEPVEQLMRKEKWRQIATLLAQAGRRVEQGGAECLLVCTNTMHKVAPAIQEAISIPLLHIADATARAIQKDHLQTIGLLGTQFTMEEDFYRGRLASTFGLDIIIPSETERKEIHRIIFEELCRGKIVEESKVRYQEIIGGMQHRGAEGVIAGCTEIGMLISPEDLSLPFYDTTRIHVERGIEFALNGK